MDEVDIEKQEDALRSLINLGANEKLLSVGSVERVVALLDADDDILVMLACWCVNNFSVHGVRQVFERFAACDVAAHFPRVLDLPTRDVLIKATWAVTNLSRDARLAQAFVARGIHGSLVQLMQDYDDDEMLEHAIDPLYNLLYADAALAVTFARAGVIKVAVKALRAPTAPFALKAKLLRFLSMFTLTNDVLRKYLVAEGILEPLYLMLETNAHLLTFLENPNPDYDDAVERAEAQAVALRTLNNLAVADANELAILHSGCLIPVVDLLRSEDPLIVTNAASVLANLSQNELVRDALRHYGWLDSLLHLIRAQTSTAATYGEPNEKLLDCLARFLCNVTIDEWSRQMLLDHQAAPLVRAAATRFAALESVALYLQRALENLSLPISMQTLLAMEERYGPKPLSPRDPQGALMRRVQSQAALQAQRPISWTPQKTEFIVKDDSAIVKERPRQLDWMGSSSSLSNLKPVSFSSASGLSSMAPAELVKPLHALSSISPTTSSTSSPSPSRQQSEPQPPPRPSSATPEIAPASPPVPALGSQRPSSERLTVVRTTQGPKEVRVSMPPGLHRQSSKDESVTSSPAPSPSPTVTAKAPQSHYSPLDGQNQVKREHISRELLSTETSYINSLSLMFEILVEPSKRFLNSVQMTETFGGLDEIFEINSAFFASLQARMASWTWDTQIADLFLQLADRLRVYSTFINKYPIAMANYGEYIEQNARYKGALQALIQVKLPAVPVPLLAGHFFIMPVQRIPRYIMLLEDLLRATPPTHPDSKVLVIALDKLRTVANQINDAKAKAEESGKLATLSSKIVGFPGQLMKPGRFLVKEGSLIRRYRSAKGKWKANYVYLVLLNDMLVETLQERRTYTFQASYLAEHFDAALSDPGDDDVKRDKFLFRVRLRGASEELIFLCDTEEFRSDWISSFSRLIDRKR